MQELNRTEKLRLFKRKLVLDEVVAEVPEPGSALPDEDQRRIDKMYKIPTSGREKRVFGPRLVKFEALMLVFDKGQRDVFIHRTEYEPVVYSVSICEYTPAGLDVHVGPATLSELHLVVSCWKPFCCGVSLQRMSQ